MLIFSLPHTLTLSVPGIAYRILPIAPLVQIDELVVLEIREVLVT